MFIFLHLSKRFINGIRFVISLIHIHAIFMMKVNKGEPMDWVKIMFKNLVKEFDRWMKVLAKMLEENNKMDAKDMCNFSLVIEVLM